MTAISGRQPEVTVWYDKGGRRAAKHFEDAHAAKRFYTAKHKAGANPSVRAPSSSPKRTACYVRVSTVGQNESGQVAELERWLAGNGIPADAVVWFIDKKSGDSLKRPAFEQLQTAVFNGEVSTIVCYRLDRISRSIRDGINTLIGWCEKGIRVVATSQQLDFSGSLGQLLAATLFGIAQMEQEVRRERQRVGIERAREAGKYASVGRKKGSTKASPQRARELRQRGHTAPEISRLLGVSRNTVFRYLREVSPLESPK